MRGKSLDLMEWADRRTRSADPATSREAAASLTTSVTAIKLRVLNYARQCGERGFTDAELSEAMDCTGSTYRTRRAELVAAGAIVKTGAVRRSTRGRAHIIWRIASHQKEKF